jgi:hypothetical protein
MDQILRFCASTPKRFPPDSAESGFEDHRPGDSREESAVSIHIDTASMFYDPKVRPRCVVRARIPGVYILGYLHLDIEQWLQGGDEFESLIHGEDEFSILRGWYLSSCTQSILERNSMDGLMLDTTWKIIRKYMTTIIMAVYRNVGIPLGLAFGTAETMELYEQHFGAFNHMFGIDLSHYILEPDQGSALCSLGTSKGQVQLFCLRHFLLSLKQNEFSCQIGNLVKCQTEDKFESLRRMYRVFHIRCSTVHHDRGCAACPWREQGKVTLRKLAAAKTR